MASSSVVIGYYALRNRYPNTANAAIRQALSIFLLGLYPAIIHVYGFKICTKAMNVSVNRSMSKRLQPLE